MTNARGKRTRGEERAISHRGGHKYSGRANINLIFSCENTIIRIKYRKTGNKGRKRISKVRIGAGLKGAKQPVSNIRRLINVADREAKLNRRALPTIKRPRGIVSHSFMTQDYGQKKSKG